MKKHPSLQLSLLVLGMLMAQSLSPLSTSASNPVERAGSNSVTVPLAAMSDEISVHAARRGNPWINLSDGRELMTAYVGDGQAVWALQQNEARGLSLASDDFDEDGTADLVCGYRAADGSGIIALHRGNVDSIHPNSLEAQQRRARGEATDAPFLAPARVFELPAAAEFLGAGDFDSDGHRDVVAASSTEEALYLMRGDGQGGLAEAERIELPGRVTAMAVGEINRADGLEDVVVGVNGLSGPEALVFEGPKGAMRSEAEAIILPDKATSLAIGQLDDSYEYDLAIAAGSELLVVQGRSRLMGEAGGATMSRRGFPFSISALAIGEFVADGVYSPDIAVLAEDGRVQYLRRGELEHGDAGTRGHGDEWQAMAEVRVAQAAPLGDTASRRVLTKVKVSSLATDDLLVIDRASNQMRIVSGGPSSKLPLHEMTTLDVEGEAAVALPMELNSDALSDLVMLKGNSNELTVAMTRPMATFTVNTVADSGPGSLRRMIEDANASAGPDTIEFGILDGEPGFITKTIVPRSPLPQITDPVLLDGTTQPGSFPDEKIVVLDGLFVRGDGLKISAGLSIVRGLTISSFDRGAGISLSGGRSNRVVGCFIGTDFSGLFPDDNDVGIVISRSAGNTIGGTQAPAGNLISGNMRPGILISDGSSMNEVQGSKIGTNRRGSRALFSRSNATGVEIVGASNNTIGGMTETAGNLISGNKKDGILLGPAATGNQVIGNKIGTDINGVFAVRNRSSGVRWDRDASDNTIGLNTIAFNNLTGVEGSPDGGGGNFITANSIYCNKSLGIDLGGNGVTDNDDPPDPDQGANRLQNFPILVAQKDANGNCTIRGVLESTPNLTFRIEFFANYERDPSGHGEGETFLDFKMVTTDNAGRAEFMIPAPRGADAGPVITATATDPASNTSEFSPQILLCPDSTVTTTANDGIGSLQNALLGGGVIDFNISRNVPGFDPAKGTWTITPQTPLPLVTKPTFIYCSSQPGFVDKPVIGINGAAITTPNTPGLDILAANSVVEGLSIYGFSGDGIRIRPPASKVSIIDSLIGLKPDGSPGGNDGNGIRVFSSASNRIINNVISNNDQFAVAIDNQGTNQGAKENLVLDNLIGTDCMGVIGLGNNFGAVAVVDSPSNSIVDNVIATRGGATSLNFKLLLFGPGTQFNRVEGNCFGTDQTGTINLGGLNTVGIVIDRAANNLISANCFANLRNAILTFGTGGLNFYQGNSISSTVNQAIDRGDNGPDSNLVALISAAQTNSTRIQGTFRGRSNAAYTIEFFSNTACHPTGFGPGQFFIDSAIVTTDGGGNANFDVTLDATVPAGHFITATATNDVDGTTEFSRCAQVTGAARTDVALTKTGPAAISAGQTITYTLEAKNISQATAFGVMVTDDLPACLTNIFCNVSQGDCTVRGNRVFANLGSIEPQGTATVTITARVDQACGQGLTNTARVTAASDTNAVNDSSTANTSIRPGPKITSLKLKGASKLIVTGENFQSGAKIKVIKPDGAETQVNKTKFNSETKLTGKGAVIAPGDRVVVENPDGTRSNEMVFAASG